jgi:parallel beta-helix repeat protein
MGNIVVQNGALLTIEPGVTVEFQGNYNLNVQGRILAIGTETDSILFTAMDPDTGFNSIYFLNTPHGNDSSVFMYCRIEHANRHGAPWPYHGAGAIGVENFDKIRIDRCYFLNNRAHDILPSGPPRAGAVGIIGSDILIQHCTFYSNASSYGGALEIYLQSQPVISHCLFVNNIALSDGGAVSINDSSAPTFYRNTFSSNTANQYGGAVYIAPIELTTSSDLVFEGNLFFGNHADAGGGAIEIIGPSRPVFRNNTIYGNSSYGHVGGLDLFLEAAPVVINTILWGNVAGIGNQVYIWTNGAIPEFHYSDIHGGSNEFGGEPFTGIYLNNIDADPMLCDTILGDFRIHHTSPCRETGDSTCMASFGKRCDMGAYINDYCWPVAIQQPGGRDHSSQVTIRPNPFSTTTRFSYSLNESCLVRFEIMNSIGQVVAKPVNGLQQSGEYTFDWNTAGLPVGIYLYRL